MRNNKEVVTYRFARVDDVSTILYFIKELARFEKMEDEVVATENLLRETLFGKRQYAEVVFVQYEGKDVGFCLFFHNYSTFLGKPGIYIEDLFVLEEYRNRGLGKSLLTYISCLAKERSCGRVEWWVLDWNPARKFYEHIGAVAQSEWITYRLSGNALDSLVQSGTEGD